MAQDGDAPQALLPEAAVEEMPEAPAQEAPAAHKTETTVDVPLTEPQQQEEPDKADEAPKPTSKAARARGQPATPAAGASGASRTHEPRVRKAVQPIYKVEIKKEEEFVIKEGKGAKLRDIPNVVFKLSKITGRDELLESLHTLLFRRKGTTTQRKKAILDFSGWAFDEATAEREVHGREATLGKWKLELIHRLMDALDLPRGSGDKAGKVARVMEFLAAPHKERDVDLAAKEAVKKQKKQAKRKRAAKKEATPKGGKKAKRDEAAEEEEEEEDGEEEEDKEEEEGRKEAAGKPDDAGPEHAANSKPHGEAPAPAEPAATAATDPALAVPSDELAAHVKAVLAKLSVDELRGMTLKPLTRALQEQYGFSVRARKAEIKDIAQAYADSLAVEEGDDDGNDA